MDERCEMPLYKIRDQMANKYIRLGVTYLIGQMQIMCAISYEIIVTETTNIRQKKAYIQQQLEIKKNQV